MLTTRNSWMILLCVAALAPLRVRAEYTNEWIVDVQNRLESGDPVAQRKAIAEIDQYQQDLPVAAAGQLGARWFKPMIAGGFCKDAARLARVSVLAVPYDAESIDALLRWRIEALQKAGQPREALADARLLFEICPMGRTESSLLLLGECLNRAYPTDSTIVQRLMREQLAGAKISASASTSASQSATQPASLLGEIAVDRKPYQDALEQLNSEIGPDPQRYVDLASKGNLLILAGRPAEAAVVFAKLERLVDYDQLRIVDDALARVLKAQDLSIGRANGYVQSLKKAAAPAAPPAH